MFDHKVPHHVLDAVHGTIFVHLVLISMSRTLGEVAGCFVGALHRLEELCVGDVVMRLP